MADGALQVVQIIHPGFEYRRRERVGPRAQRSGVMSWKPGRSSAGSRQDACSPVGRSLPRFPSGTQCSTATTSAPPGPPWVRTSRQILRLGTVGMQPESFEFADSRRRLWVALQPEVVPVPLTRDSLSPPWVGSLSCTGMLHPSRQGPILRANPFRTAPTPGPRLVRVLAS